MLKFGSELRYVIRSPNVRTPVDIPKINSNIRNETAEIANFYFSHYKSLQTENCHSNQSSYLTGTKKIFVAANARNMDAKYQLQIANSF